MAVEAADARRQYVEERPVVVPALDEDEPGPPLEGVFQPLAVAGDRQPRVVRREHQADEGVGSAGERRLDRLRDPGEPVLHADEDRQPKLALEPRTLCLGDLVERRASTDPAVAL